MKSRIPVLAIFAFAVLFAAGCSKTDSPAPKTAAPPAKDIVAAPAETIPDPVTRKDAGASVPKPGQAGDHSSPAFKGGGAPDPGK